MYVYISLVKSLLLSEQLLAKNCSLGLRYVLFVFVPDCKFDCFPPCFKSGTFALITPFPDKYLLLPFKNRRKPPTYG